MVVFSITVAMHTCTVIEKTTINVTFDLRYYATFSVMLPSQMHSPSIETHLAMVRGLHTKKFLAECVNEKSSTEHHS